VKYLIKVAYRQLKDLLYRIRTFSARARALRTFPDLSALNNPFFIVGIPGSLHVVELCLKFVPSDVDIVLVANGLDAWELGWAREHLKVKTTVVIERMLDHGDVLDLLFEKYHRPFGILDYDCFVINPNSFQRIREISSECMLNAFFIYRNETLGLELPETFFLYFNTPVINSIKRQYSINSKSISFDLLSKKVKKQLAKIGIDRGHYPEEYKKHFDTLRLIMAIGLAEGYKINFLERYPAGNFLNRNIFHVGGVARPNVLKGSWQVRGSYFWRRLLEVCNDPQLILHYEKQFGSITSTEILDLHPDSRNKIGTEFVQFVDEIIQKNR